ncbi:hypothetical protein ACP4OV_023248 [Aristida adscensionis]
MSSSYAVWVQALRDNSEYDTKNNTSVFIAEEGWFGQDMTFEALSSSPAPSTIPVVLAWMVRSDVLPGPNETRDGKETCPTDLHTNICHSEHNQTLHVQMPRGFPWQPLPPGRMLRY